MCPNGNRQRGFGIIAAIVILVILTSLAAFLVTLSTTQQVGSALDVQGARAKAAAESGVEWGLFQALKEATPPCATSPGTATDVASIGGMRVTVTCTIVASGGAVEAGLGTIYLVSAIACNLPSGTTCPGSVSNPNYVERSVVALVEK